MASDEPKAKKQKLSEEKKEEKKKTETPSEETPVKLRWPEAKQTELTQHVCWGYARAHDAPSSMWAVWMLQIKTSSLSYTANINNNN